MCTLICVSKNILLSDERLTRHQRDVLAYMSEGTGSTLGQREVELRDVEGVHGSVPRGGD